MTTDTRINNNLFSTGLSWARENHAFVLILLTFILFTSKSLYNVPAGLMALLGLKLVICSRGKVFSDPLIRAYSLLFLTLWLPLLFSLPDAANFAHSAQTAFPYVRFLFMGIYVLSEKDNLALLPRLQLACFCVAAFWGIDGCIQYLAGMNLAGFPYEPGHITGMFYPRNTIAHILAAFSPIYFETIRMYSKRYKWLWLLLLPLITVILLSGRRAAWLMLGISLCGYLYYLFRYTVVSEAIKRSLSAIAIVSLMAVVFFILGNKPLQNRIVITAGLFSLDYEAADLATARRFPIWETSITVFRDNWINGVGPRGFRHVYQQYSTADNFWYKTPPTHPHQLLFEVMVETGLIGIAGLILFVWMIYRSFITSPELGVVFTWLLSVLIIIFPFSSNLAFYSSYWASVIWWFLVLSYLALKHSKIAQARHA